MKVFVRYTQGRWDIRCRLSNKGEITLSSFQELDVLLKYVYGRAG